MISARDRPWVALCSFRFSAIARSVMISATGKARASNGLWRSFSAIARSVMISAANELEKTLKKPSFSAIARSVMISA